MKTRRDGRQGPVTLYDVAEVAGVSAMSVSRVLSGKQPTSAELDRKVRAAIEQTGFRMNVAASNLRRGVTLRTIGLVVDRIDDPFFAMVNRAVESVASEHEALLIVSSTGEEPDRERTVIGALNDRGIDGLLLYPTADFGGEGQDSRGRMLPVVLMGRSSGNETVDAVVVDNVSAVRDAIEHLVAHGHRRIGVIANGEETGHGDSDTRAGRLEGYRQALEKTGIAMDPALIAFGGSQPRGAAEAAEHLLSLADPPTALLATNNRMSVGTLGRLGSGLRGLAFVGVDDFELAEVFSPSITVVRQDPYAIGEAAARMLFRRLREPNLSRQRLDLALELVPRGSGEIPPASRG